MSGQDAQRGFIFQSIVAIIECLERNDWDEIKLEPEPELDKELDKVDIQLYQNGTIISAIQVKSSINQFERYKVSEWLKELKIAAPAANEVTLYLVGDLFAPECEKYISQNKDNIRKISFRDLTYTCKGKLAQYVTNAGLGDDVRVNDLDLIDASIFTIIHKNSIAKEKLSRDAFEKAFRNALSRYDKGHIGGEEKTTTAATVTESAVDFSPYYKLVRKRFTRKKQGDYEKLVGAYSDEEAYIDAYIDGSNGGTPALSFLEDWFNKDSYGTLLIYGEPGHGKSMLCAKAMFEFNKGAFLPKANNVLSVSLNVGTNRNIIKDGTINIDASLSWNGHPFTFEDCRGALIFMDGFDEFIDEAKKIDDKINIISFMKMIEDKADEYDIHIVVLSRAIAISAALEERSAIKSQCFELMPITEQQQDIWLDQHSEYKEYKKTLRVLRENPEMGKLLGIPFLFRMIVHTEYDGVGKNTVELYESLVDHLMDKRDICGNDLEQVTDELCGLAYDIYCNDTNTAVIEGNRRNEKWMLAFYIKQIGKGIYGFFHRSFYQYFLARFLLSRIQDIKTDKQAEDFIGLFAERELDDTVRQYLSLLINDENKTEIHNKLKLAIEAFVRTEAYVNLEPRYPFGNAEKKKIGRTRNIYRNTLYICEAFSYVIHVSFRENIDVFIRLFSGNNITIYSNSNRCADLSRANLEGAYLIRADLSGADLSFANLNGAKLNESNLSKANLSGVCLKNADLSGANLNSADLKTSDLSETILDEVNLSGANLCKAKLRSNDLRGNDLNGANLSEADLRKVDLNDGHLSEVNLSKADLSEADLSGADLSRADLSRANLRDAKLNGAILSGADLSGADLSGAKLAWVDLRKVGLSGVNLSGVFMYGVKLSGADLSGEDLSGADLCGADLSRANLREAKLSGVNLSGANLSEVDLSGADLSGADLSRANLREAKLSGVNLSGVNLSGVDLSGVDLSGVDLSGTNLSGADLSRADLSGANLGRANLSGVGLMETNLSGANLNGVDLSGIALIRVILNGANLCGADLSGVDLRDVNLKGVSLNRANLRRAKLNRAKLNEANLREANLSGADLRGADLRGADFSNAIIDRAYINIVYKELIDPSVDGYETIIWISHSDDTW